MGNNGRISTVLISYRTPDLLASCLKQLAAEPCVGTVVVVDNASGDGSAELVERDFPGVRLLRNGVNVGFARAVNQALFYCEDEFLLLLNPDTELAPDAINRLRNLLIDDPAVGAVGPAIGHPGGRLRVLSAGRQPTLWRMFTHASLLSRFSRRVPLLEGLNLLAGVHDDRARDVEWLTGACLLARREAIVGVGGLSERWFMYAEDIELSWRLHRAGWRLVHLPSARILHHMGASEDQQRPQNTAWAVNLHDHYRSDLSTGVGADLAWRTVFVAQLMSRSLYYRLRALRAPTATPDGTLSRASWTREAVGFAASAAAVIRQPLARGATPSSRTPAGTGSARFDVLGVGISAVSLVQATAQIRRWLDDGERQYVCVTNVHTVMECRRDPALMAIHNESGLTTPDGMPIVWCGKRAGATGITRVYGPDLMLSVCSDLASTPHSVFLYGTTPSTLELLTDRLLSDFPGLRVAGSYAPPFRPLTPAEDAEVIERINASGADLVWVGLGAPKQEFWMASHAPLLRAKVLIGVGAAFDFHAGTVRQAPVWIQRHGLEWLYRLVHEPRRLWKRYLRTNPAFVWGVLRHPPKLRVADHDSADRNSAATVAGA